MIGNNLMYVFAALLLMTSALQADAIATCSNDTSLTDVQKDEQQVSKPVVQSIEIAESEVSAENIVSFALPVVGDGDTAGTLSTGLATPQGSDTQGDRPRKPFQYNGNGFVYFTFGACQHGYKIVGVGGGGEGFIWKGLTIGGDLSLNQFVNDVRFSLASLRLGYHFVDRSRPNKFDPFVNFSALGGYLAGGIGSAASIGGGTYYWFKERIGLRTEVRYHKLPCESLIQFRIGVGIR